MKFSKNWLLEFVAAPATTEQLAEKFTSLGFEVESVTPIPTIANLVVAEIQEAMRHPDAERLQVCKVFDGRETYQIVCGAKNARPGIKVALAKIGAELPKGVKISKAKLRGVESCGMLCSTSELGLTETSEGILELPHDVSLGTNLSDYFGFDDSIIDLAITPNRGDCLSLKGLAREIAVAYQLSTSVIASEAKQSSKNGLPRSLQSLAMTIRVDEPTLCPRYSARTIKGINAAATTPVWMQEKLRRSGLRSIHPVVDVTNYVMLECGQPMHAFDLAKIDTALEVRLAKAGEQLTLLDERTVNLREDTLIIADLQQPLALAGIMGGKASAVTAQTTDILLESAFFSPDYSMGHARHYNLTTDSSQRFERGVDPQLTLTALNRASELILEICGGTASEITEIIAPKKLPVVKTIHLRRERINRVLGITIADNEVTRILTNLGLTVDSNRDGWSVHTPSWRFDLNIEVDLIEELARVHGYNNIPAQAPMSSLVAAVASATHRTDYILKQQLAAHGYYETLTYSFIDPKIHTLLFPEQKSVTLINPISADLSVMRTSLWPNLLAALLNNVNHQQERVRLFETGRVFLPNGKQLDQPLKLAGLVAGSAAPEQWGIPTRKVDFFDLKGDLELLLAPCGELSFIAAEHSVLHPGQSAEIKLNGHTIGLVGALHPKLAQALKLTIPTFLFELDLEFVERIVVPKYRQVSKFPSIRRDLSVVLSDQVTFAKLYDIVSQAAGELLVDLAIFDIYQGAEVEVGHKSVAISLMLQHAERTLVDEEVNALMSKVVAQITGMLKGTLRA